MLYSKISPVYLSYDNSGLIFILYIPSICVVFHLLEMVRISTFSYNSFAYTCVSILIVFALNSSLAVLIASLTILVPNPQRLFFAMILPMDASSKVVPGGRIRAYA
jgi:hypothetical protein